MCSILQIEDLHELVHFKPELLHSVTISHNRLVIQKQVEPSPRTKVYLFTCTSELNTAFVYRITFYRVHHRDAYVEDEILVEAETADENAAKIKPLVITEREICEILQISPEALKENLYRVEPLLIVEGASELGIARRVLGANIPEININVSSSNETNYYRKLSMNCAEVAKPAAS